MTQADHLPGDGTATPIRSTEVESGNAATVRTYLDRLSAFEIERWGELIHPEAVQENPYSPPNFPSRFEGLEAIMEHHRSLPDTFTSMAFDRIVVRPTADPQTVIVEFDGAIGLKDGGRYDNRYISVFEFDADGLITLTREYFNPLVLLESFSGDTKLHGLA